MMDRSISTAIGKITRMALGQWMVSSGLAMRFYINWPMLKGTGQSVWTSPMNKIKRVICWRHSFTSDLAITPSFWSTPRYNQVVCKHNYGLLYIVQMALVFIQTGPSSEACYVIIINKYIFHRGQLPNMGKP